VTYILDLGEAREDLLVAFLDLTVFLLQHEFVLLNLPVLVPIRAIGHYSLRQIMQLVPDIVEHQLMILFLLVLARTASYTGEVRLT
jgi:hypothetical protein